MICPSCQGAPHRLGRGCVRCDDTGRIEAYEETGDGRPLVSDGAVDAVRAALRSVCAPLGWADGEHIAYRIAVHVDQGGADVDAIAGYARIDRERAAAVLAEVSR